MDSTALESAEQARVYQYAFTEEGPDYEKIARKPSGYSRWD